jgi:hypothetical protein
MWRPLILSDRLRADRIDRVGVAGGSSARRIDQPQIDGVRLDARLAGRA